MGRKLGAVPLWGGGDGSPCNTTSLGPTLTSLSTFVPSGILIHPAVWPQQTRTENWGFSLFCEGELGSHLKQCGRGRRLPPCQVYSNRLATIHQRYRQNRTGRQRSDSIGRTFLQTVAQKQKYDSNEIMSRLCCRNAPLILQFFIRNNEICYQNFSVRYCGK